MIRPAIPRKLRDQEKCRSLVVIAVTIWTNVDLDLIMKLISYRFAPKHAIENKIHKLKDALGRQWTQGKLFQDMISLRSVHWQ